MNSVPPMIECAHDGGILAYGGVHGTRGGGHVARQSEDGDRASVLTGWWPTSPWTRAVTTPGPTPVDLVLAALGA